MKISEYNKFKTEILEYMDIEDLKENLKNYKSFKNIYSTYQAGAQMVQDGCFACYYSQVLATLKDVYGTDYKAEAYETKDGQLRWKNGEAYCWTVYKHKMALTIETMEKKGDI